MEEVVQLVGLDFGSTTSSAVVAQATLRPSLLTGRTELVRFVRVFESELILTPWDGPLLDLKALRSWLESWMIQGGVSERQVFGGGALITGLAARAANASDLASLVRARLGDALIARAEDPCLESWMAFMGSSLEVSRQAVDRPVLNLDIGGGTTNLALGLNGQVLSTGCLLVGARHVRCRPGSWQVEHCSPQAEALLAAGGLSLAPGQSLDEPERQCLLDFYLRLLENILLGDAAILETPLGRLHCQVPLRVAPELPRPRITFSGGVGRLVYAALAGEPLPEVNRFGDLGVELALRLVQSPLSADCLIPAATGRATVFGLLEHATQVSGATLYLSDSRLLPVRDLPVVGRLEAGADEEHLRTLLRLICRASAGGAILLMPRCWSREALRTLSQQVRSGLTELQPPPECLLVLLMQENLAKVLGSYISNFGTPPVHLLVIDEIEPLNAQFVQLGLPRFQSVPVSFYGMNP